MRLVIKVEIDGFRSIRHADLKDLSGFTAFAGLNNSGKSNILRALNAFFNDQTDADHPLNVDADYHRPDLRKKKRKRIRVAVKFNLPDNFQFRKGLEAVKNLLEDKRDRGFLIAKEWTRSQPQPSFFLDGEKVSEDDTQKLKKFLDLIKFRYIPNRVLPTDVIRSEHQNLRDILVRRLSRHGDSNEHAFKAIQETSTKIIDALKKRFSQACPGQGDVVLATPASWQDLAFAFGYRLVQGDVQIEDTAQGSGVQSLLMLETLHLVDRDYFQQFGWRQAAIWAFEEPESSLHTSLEARVAHYLKQITSDASNRLQILCTTHSDLIVQYANETFVMDQREGETQFRLMKDAREALSELSGAGVSRWIHPILQFPLDPLILVEGKFDVAFLEEAFKILRPKRSVRVADVSKLEGIYEASGVDKLSKYVKNSSLAIQARRTDAPVVVLLDWDAQSKIDEFQKFLPPTAPYKVLAWPDAALNPSLGNSFKGVERAYSSRIIEEGIGQGANIGRNRNNMYMVQSDDYGRIKSSLSAIVKNGLRENDLAHCKNFLCEVLQAAGVDE